jgi:hypothetical protein
MLKKNGKSKSWKKIRRSLKRIAVPFLAVVFFASLMRMGGTNASFLNKEKSGEISVSMGAVNFSLESPADFSDAVTASQSASRDIELKDKGTLDFQYRIKSGNFSGDLCDHLKLKVKFDGGIDLHSGGLNTFSYAVGNFSDPEKLKFTAELDGSDSGLQGKKCNFDLVFEGWQKSITNFEDGGFSDTEKIVNEVKFEGDEAKNLVINEVYYDDSSGDDTGKEWIEIYNGTNDSINLDGYELNATSGDYFVFPNSFSIGSKKFAVIHWRTSGTNSTTDLFTGTTGYDNNMGNTSGYVAFFDGDHNIGGKMVDYLEYGAGGQTGESKAVSAGIWTSGDFVPDAAEGYSLSRKIDGQDTNSPLDFKELSTPTPGS